MAGMHAQRLSFLPAATPRLAALKSKKRWLV
jgi:hypothetical protein